MESIADNLLHHIQRSATLDEAWKKFVKAVDERITDDASFTYVYNEAEAEMKSWREILTAR